MKRSEFRARQRAALLSAFPGWRIRAVTDHWIAARTGTPVVVASTAYELQEQLRRLGPTRPEEPAGP